MLNLQSLPLDLFRRSRSNTSISKDTRRTPLMDATGSPDGALNAPLGRIHHQDCIAGMNALPAGSVDLAFADPPFNIGYEYDVYHDSKDYEQYLAWSRDWIAAVHRVLAPDGTFWLAIGDEYAAELKLLAQRHGGFHIP